MKTRYLSHNNIRYTFIGELQTRRYTIIKAISESGKLVIIKSLVDLMGSEDKVEQEDLIFPDSHSSEFLENVNEGEHNKACLDSEYNFLQRLNHPGIVKAIDRGDDFIVLDYHFGDDFRFEYDNVLVLESKVDKKTNPWKRIFNKFFNYDKEPELNILDCGKVRNYLFDFYFLLNTVDFLHHNNIIHKDLKPENVIKTKKNIVLIDFELALDYTKPIKKSSYICGTLHYLSPEHVLGEALDPRSDIYSLGVMLYQSLVKHPLFFDFSGRNSIISNKMKYTYFSARRENPLVPEDLDAVIKKATHREKKKRFDCIGEFQESLKQFIV